MKMAMSNGVLIGMLNMSPRKDIDKSLEQLLSSINSNVGRVLYDALEGRDVSVEGALVLFDASGPELVAIQTTADELRRRSVGDLVTYVVNRQY